MSRCTDWAHGTTTSTRQHRLEANLFLAPYEGDKLEEEMAAG
jgi:hypothetical protein